MSSIAENLSQVRKKIEEACNFSNRYPKDISLILVSKGQNFSSIKECYNLGIRDFGENYISEWKIKYELAINEGLNDIKWHFLGRIQSNKISLISKFSLIHSIDSLSHAIILNNYIKTKIDIFLQIKLSEKDKKAGIFENDIISVINDIKSLSNLNIRGLMTILPLESNKSASFWFEKMSNLKKELLSKNVLQKVELSMGMSTDFYEAIIYGADLIRIGTKVFGIRKVN